MKSLLNSKFLNIKFGYTLKIVSVLLLTGCASKPSQWENITEEGVFLVHRRQSLIGEETYSITSNKDSIVVKSLQGENERGRITGEETELHLKMDLTPTYYENRRVTAKDTINNLKVKVTPSKVLVWESDTEVVTSDKTSFFPLHSGVSTAAEMMLYYYYFENGKPKSIPTLPRGEVSITFRQKDTVEVNGNKIPLDRYIVTGINWGTRTIWVDESNKLVAVVQANTQIREMIRKEYGSALKFFVNGNVEEQMAVLSGYTNKLKNSSEITALVGGDVVDGLSDNTKKDMTIIVENGLIKTIGSRAEVVIPKNAKIIDVSGKTLIPGLWDMHAHSNQVQWAPTYLAGGVTTIRDNGNEVEFATAFRDAIALNGALGPDILLAGMTDGEGIRGNGIIRARTPEEAKEVVAMYHKNGYKQIKIYSSVEPEIVKILSDEAHKIGMTVAGHVPNPVGNAKPAIELGMDLLSHSNRILTVLFPEKDASELNGNYLTENGVSEERIQRAIAFLLEHKTVLDPTIGLYVKRGLLKGVPVETIMPRIGDMPYELWEGKRFQKGMNPKASKAHNEEVALSMEILGRFYNAGIPVVAGTDNSAPGFGLYLEMETYCKLGKLTPFQSLQTATIVPAKAMGLDSKTGSLEVGKEADIAILDKNPLENIENIRTVTSVMTNGNYYESNPLWKAADFNVKE
ncbi:amidohydrolase family protein [Mariniflexile sp.]|uniref:amidohydrolase family protein n=1 Tax=Mariniflexile sp. TaxID=1979402 RepID=UPI0035635C32